MYYKSFFFICGVLTLFTINFISGKFYTEEFVTSKSSYYKSQEATISTKTQELHEAYDKFKYQLYVDKVQKENRERNSIIDTRYKQAEKLFKVEVENHLNNSIKTCNNKKYFVSDGEKIHTFDKYQIKYTKERADLDYFRIKADIIFDKSMYLRVNENTEKGLWEDSYIDDIDFEGAFSYNERADSLRQSYMPKGFRELQNISSRNDICSQVNITTYVQQKKKYVDVSPYNKKAAYEDPDYIRNYFINTLNNRTIFCDGLYYLPLRNMWVRGTSRPKATFKENTVEISMSSPEVFITWDWENKRTREWGGLNRNLLMTYEKYKRGSWKEIHIKLVPISEYPYRSMSIRAPDYDTPHGDCHDIPQ